MLAKQNDHKTNLRRLMLPTCLSSAENLKQVGIEQVPTYGSKGDAVTRETGKVDCIIRTVERELIFSIVHFYTFPSHHVSVLSLAVHKIYTYTLRLFLPSYDTSPLTPKPSLHAPLPSYFLSNVPVPSSRASCALLGTSCSLSLVGSSSLILSALGL